MPTCKDKILTFASKQESFGKDELWDYLRENDQSSANTMACMLTQMIETGELCRVSQGRYSLAPTDRQVFHAVIEEREKSIMLELKQKFPFATFCIYNGKSLATLQHHVSENNITYIETERYAVDSVFDYLKSQGYTAWKNPKADFMYMYVDLKAEAYIIKPLVTEAPTEDIDGIQTPTLEKLLVDIKKDPCFVYLQGTESERMWQNAQENYIINQTRLKRYARRRGLKTS